MSIVSLDSETPIISKLFIFVCSDSSIKSFNFLGTLFAMTKMSIQRFDLLVIYSGNIFFLYENKHVKSGFYRHISTYELIWSSIHMNLSVTLDS